MQREKNSSQTRKTSRAGKSLCPAPIPEEGKLGIQKLTKRTLRDVGNFVDEHVSTKTEVLTAASSKTPSKAGHEELKGDVPLIQGRKVIKAKKKKSYHHKQQT